MYVLVCGQELRDPSGGTFMTPNYPKPYHNVLDCMYSFVGPVNTVVHLNITDYDVSEYAQGCSDDSDYIEVHKRDVENLLSLLSFLFLADLLRIKCTTRTSLQR